MATGEGYVNIVVPNPKPANHYPPVYPLILAASYTLAPDSFVFAKCINGAFLLASIILLFFFFRQLDIRWELSAIICFLLMTNYHLLYFSTIMMSEIPFLFFSILALYWTLRLDSKQLLQQPFWKQKDFYILIFILAIVFHIRTIGISVIFGIISFFLLKKHWKYAIGTFGGFIILGLPWFLRGQSLGGTSYLNSLFLKNPYNTDIGFVGIQDLASRFINNFARYLAIEIPNGIISFLQLSPKKIDTYQWFLGAALICIILYGLYHLPKYKGLIFAYLFGTFGILLLWPMQWFGVRFMLPILPLLVLLLVFGIFKLLYQASQKWHVLQSKLVYPFALLAILAVSYPSVEKLHEFSEGYPSYGFQQYFLMAKWAKKNLPKDAVVCCRKPNLFYLYSNRKCVSYPATNDHTLFFNTIANSGINYVAAVDLGYKSHQTRLLPTIQKYQAHFKKVLEYSKPQKAYMFEFSSTPNESNQ